MCVCLCVDLCRGESAVGVLLLGEPAHDAGGVVEVKARHRGSREQGQQHVGRHLDLQGVQTLLRGLRPLPVAHAHWEVTTEGDSEWIYI